MAITKSAKKAIRQNKTRRAHNLIYIHKIKNLIKDVKSFVAKKQADQAKKLLPQVYQILDKAAKVGIIKKNNASRRKSRISKMVEKSAK